MELLFVNTDAGVFVFNPTTRHECLKYNIPSAGSCVVGDDIIIIHAQKPLIYSFRVQRSLQTPKKFVLPGKASSICSPKVGKFVYVGIKGSLYVWHTTTGRCVHSIQCHFQNIAKIVSNEHFTVTGGADGMVNIFETQSLLDVNSQPKPLMKLNAHSLPVTDVYLEEDLLFTSSGDFTIKIWSLENLKAENLTDVNQGTLLITSVEYPTAVTSLSLDGLLFNLFATSSDGRLHKMKVEQKLMNDKRHQSEKTDWRHEPVTGDIRIGVSLDGLDCYTSSGSNIKVWTSGTAALLRTIPLAGSCHSFYSLIDIWGVLQSTLGKVKSKSAAMEKLAHVPTKSDVLLRFPNVRKTACPLMELVSVRAEPPSIPHPEQMETDIQEIQRLKQLNKELYRQLAINVLE